MKPTPEPDDAPAAHAEAKLARLGLQVEAMQALLVRLLQDVVRTERHLDDSRVAQLVDVNAQLVVAALTSQAEAEAAAQALKDVVQAPALDALTQLPTRTTLLARFAQAMANAKRHGGRLAVLFLDLDDFKQINDTHGHAFGDRVLRSLANGLAATVRELDTVSRHGGDEFVVLLAELTHPSDAQAVAEKLIAAVGALAEVDGRAVSVTASVGIALYPDDGEDIDTLVARADTAMYETKRRQPGGIAFHGMASFGEAGSREQPPAAMHQPAHKSAPGAADSERLLAELREANERLVLAALTAQELQAAAEQAQQRQAAVLAAVAKELGDPLAPIRIATSMLGRLPTDEPLFPRLQAIVEQQGSEMWRLVANLVDGARVGSGGLETDCRQVDVALVIDAAVAAHRSMMEARGQHFESHRPPDAIVVQGDANRLQQVVGNLLDNASKHTHDGGRIDLNVVVNADTLTLTVSDNGIGITPQMVLHVFEPFVRDAHALGLDGVGLGIGLTAARALVRAHGGDLVVRSEGVNRGSQFVVTLPLAAGGPDAA